MKFSLIIPTRDNYSELQELIASVDGLDYDGPFETIVVDQSAPKRAITPPCNGEHRYVPMEGTGAAKARNRGIRHATGNHLIFVDSNATLEKDFLKNAAAVAARYPDYSCICGLILVRGGERAYSRYMRDTRQTVGFHNFNCCLASAMMINKQCLADVGDLDEQLGTGAKYGGSEESDLVLRLLEQGRQVVYDPLFMVRHPPLDPQAMPLRRWARKHYTYGVGRGAMFRKHLRTKPLWVARAYALELMKPLAAMLVEAARFRGRQALRYLLSFLGRVAGFATYRREP